MPELLPDIKLNKNPQRKKKSLKKKIFRIYKTDIRQMNNEIIEDIEDKPDTIINEFKEIEKIEHNLQNMQKEKIIKTNMVIKKLERKLKEIEKKEEDYQMKLSKMTVQLKERDCQIERLQIKNKKYMKTNEELNDLVNNLKFNHKEKIKVLVQKEKKIEIEKEFGGIVYVDEKKVKYKSLLELEMINKWREIPEIQFKVMLILHLFYPAIIYTDYTKIKINGTTNPEENYYFNGRVFINRCQTRINKKKIVIVLDKEHHQVIEEFISTHPEQDMMCKYHYDSYRRKLKQITKRYLGEEIGLKEFNKFFLIEE